VTVGYLVDTDWVIDHFNGIRSVTERLRQLRSAGLAVSIVSLAELYEGIHYSLDPTRSEAALQRFLTGVAVLGVDDEICRVFGRERGRLRRQGRLIGTSIC